MHYWIENSISGADLGTWAGENETEALTAMCQSAGYAGTIEYDLEQLDIAALGPIDGDGREVECPATTSDLSIRCLEEDDDALAEFIDARTGLDPGNEDDGPGYRAVRQAIERGLIPPSDDGMDALISDCRWWRADDGSIYPTEASRVEPDARLLTLRWTGSMRGLAALEFYDEAEEADPCPGAEF